MGMTWVTAAEKSRRGAPASRPGWRRRDSGHRAPRGRAAEEDRRRAVGEPPAPGLVAGDRRRPQDGRRAGPEPGRRAGPARRRADAAAAPVRTSLRILER